MQELFNELRMLITGDQAISVFRSILLITFGYLIAKLLSSVIARFAQKHMSSHQSIIIKRGVFYFIIILFAVSALRELGFQLGVLLGAAGVLTVAVGFASQTSASNLISGLFLLGERPFSIGDVIKVGATTGEVLSVDLLSVKLRTYDNLYVRIPNESLIKTEVTTLTKFPIRRADLKIGVAYKEDISKVKDTLALVAEKNPLCLDDPTPLFLMLGFGDSSIDMQFSVWTKREKFQEFKSSIYEEIKIAFDAAGIEIPFPHRSFYTGSVTDPFPIHIVDSSRNETDSSGK